MTHEAHRLLTRDLVLRALADSFLKLDPRHLVRNPVIFSSRWEA